MECIQDYYTSPVNTEIDLARRHITNSLNITDDYYIYYYKCESSYRDGLRFYKKLDEKTAKNIINDILKLKDEEIEEKNYKITTEDFSISTTGNEISKILKKYRINIIL